MIIKNLKIIFLKKKKYISKKPYPTFFKQGFVFIKIFDENNNYGIGEPSPYVFDNKKLIKSLENIYLRYFMNKKIHKVDFINIKSRCKNINDKKIISCFQQAILDLKGKIEKKCLSSFIKDHTKKKIKLYGSGGMLYENQSYDILLEEAQKTKDTGFVGWKFRPKMPKNAPSHSERMKNPPKFNIQEVVDFSKKLRKQVGENFLLMFDCGCRCSSIDEAAYLIKNLNDLNFYFIEEPVKRTITSYKQLNKKIKKSIDDKFIKIAAGEHLYDQKLLNFWIKSDIDILQPDSNLLLYDEIKSLNKNSQEKVFHNWCNIINNCSNANFVRAQKENIIMEFNLLKNPYNVFFENKCYKINNGKINFQNYDGMGVEFINRKNNSYYIYEKKI